MPKTAVETAVCDICGAEVREGSLFCYNCGGSVSKEPITEAVKAPVEQPTEISPIPPNGKPTPAVVEPARRRAERMDRRQVRASNRQPTEIVWEARQGSSWAFVIASVAFLLLALVMVIAAFYLR